VHQVNADIEVALRDFHFLFRTGLLSSTEAKYLEQAVYTVALVQASGAVDLGRDGAHKYT